MLHKAIDLFTPSPYSFADMARKCSKTGKKTATGHKRSHSLRATKRTFRANIQKKRVFDPNTGEYKTIKVSAAYLRTLVKRMQEGKRV